MLNYTVTVNEGIFEVIDNNTKRVIASFINEIDANEFLQALLQEELGIVPNNIAIEQEGFPQVTTTVIDPATNKTIITQKPVDYSKPIYDQITPDEPRYLQAAPQYSQPAPQYQQPMPMVYPQPAPQYQQPMPMAYPQPAPIMYQQQPFMQMPFSGQLQMPFSGQPQMPFSGSGFNPFMANSGMIAPVQIPVQSQKNVKAGFFDLINSSRYPMPGGGFNNAFAQASPEELKVDLNQRLAKAGLPTVDPQPPYAPIYSDRSPSTQEFAFNGRGVIDENGVIESNVVGQVYNKKVNAENAQNLNQSSNQMVGNVSSVNQETDKHNRKTSYTSQYDTNTHEVTMNINDDVLSELRKNPFLEINTDNSDFIQDKMGVIIKRPKNRSNSGSFIDASLGETSGYSRKISNENLDESNEIVKLDSSTKPKTSQNDDWSSFDDSTLGNNKFSFDDELFPEIFNKDDVKKTKLEKKLEKKKKKSNNVD